MIIWTFLGKHNFFFRWIFQTYSVNQMIWSGCTWQSLRDQVRCIRTRGSPLVLSRREKFVVVNNIHIMISTGHHTHRRLVCWSRLDCHQHESQACSWQYHGPSDCRHACRSAPGSIGCESCQAAATHTVVAAVVGTTGTWHTRLCARSARPRSSLVECVDSPDGRQARQRLQECWVCVRPCMNIIWTATGEGNFAWASAGEKHSATWYTSISVVSWFATIVLRVSDFYFSETSTFCSESMVFLTVFPSFSMVFFYESPVWQTIHL